jgi:putative transposase
LSFDLSPAGYSSIFLVGPVKSNRGNHKSRQFEIQVPRDRAGTFEPQLEKKRQRRLDGFNDTVLALYARGLSAREIQAQLEELYGAEVSASLISNVTDAIYNEVRGLAGSAAFGDIPRSLFRCPIRQVPRIRAVKIKTVYLVLGINLEGGKELLGLWMSETEGAKFRLSVFYKLKGREVED